MHRTIRASGHAGNQLKLVQNLGALLRQQASEPIPKPDRRPMTTAVKIQYSATCEGGTVARWRQV